MLTEKTIMDIVYNPDHREELARLELMGRPDLVREAGERKVALPAGATKDEACEALFRDTVQPRKKK